MRVLEKGQFKASLLELYKGFLQSVLLTLAGGMEVFKPRLGKA